jgi:hypothetical protein
MKLPDRGTVQRKTAADNTLREKVGDFAPVASNVACAILPVSGQLTQPETGREYLARRQGYFRANVDIRVADRFIQHNDGDSMFLVVDVATYGGKVKVAVMDRLP